MHIIDIYEKINKCGTFATWMGIADLHILIDTDDEDAYQPLDYDAFIYLRACANELKADKKHYGKIYTFTAGDLSELERSGVRKVMKALRKNDKRAQDTIHKKILNDNILPKVKSIVEDTKFVGGVAGNHMVVFSPESKGTGYPNSEAYIIRRLGGEYCGEGLMLINYHINMGSQRVLKKILVMHGSKGGTKTAILKQLQKMHDLGVRLDWVVCAHAHDPFTAFYAKYDFPDTSTGKIKKHICLVSCLGATRDGIKNGYDDYTEHGLYSPSAGRFPVGIFIARKPSENNGTLDVIIRPLTM
jgi:hypothetical protein